MKFKELPLKSSFWFEPSKDGFFHDPFEYVKLSYDTYSRASTYPQTVYTIGSKSANVRTAKP